MHALTRLAFALAFSLPGVVQAQNYHVVPPPVQGGAMRGYGPAQPMPPGTGYGGYGPGGGHGRGYGCYGCAYVGDYDPNGGNVTLPVAPPKRIQGQWRNGQWYY
ncbi:hypothetical protein [Methylocystis iwaonis]|uniref:Uncharacterized protein n=1 Tax=Methylocystis iwaonis TaxID=2885079 RepID=A0ABM8ECY6_9HYPH|nr:hypothetical protein [Methylocystis iwaonis]BDV35867.1 hypothetical protein SS37A_33960 [Methylocystis iwaonis]